MHNLNIKHIALALTTILFLLVSIGFVDKYQGDLTCRSIVVNIDNQFENYFVNEKDVVNLLTSGGNMIVGARMDELELQQIESRLEDHKFVRNAEAYKDLKGNLIINIDQSRPVARMMGKKMPDRYISARGEVLPTSRSFTTRVMLITGPWPDNPGLLNMNDTETGKAVLRLIKYINDDPFWKSQIAEMYIEKHGEVTIYTQVSKQRVEFGQPENIENKFRKLKIFYKKILPTKGWNSYKKVNIKYNNQIVCE